MDKSGEKKEQCPVYYDAESVEGMVTVRVKDGKKLVHEGIRLELVGAIGKSGTVRAKREESLPSGARGNSLPSAARRKLSRAERE